MSIQFYQQLMKIVGSFNRKFFPARLFLQSKLKPASSRFGYDRGTPIDRYWIESFLQENKKHITGVCLEIGDNRYTHMFGNRVNKSDILDINSSNKSATIVGDIRNLRSTISDCTYDCMIVTQVFGMVDDIHAAISECFRILKPNGVLLATMSSLSPTYDIDHSYWRFTTTSAQYLFDPVFGKANTHVSGYGNVLAGQSFWIGLAKEDLSTSVLDFYDKRYQCLVAVKAVHI